MTYHYILKKNIDSTQDKFTKIKFYIHRFFRLYPLYFLVILAGYFTYPYVNNLAIVFGDFFHGKHQLSFTYGMNNHVNFSDLFMHLTFFHGFFHVYNTTIIGPACSLSTEVQFYAIFPFLIPLLEKKNIIYLLLISIALYLISAKLLGIWDTSGSIMKFGAPSLLIQKMLYFNAGILLGKYVLGECQINLVLFNMILVAYFSLTFVSTIVCAIILILMLSNEIKEYIPTPLNWFILTIKKFMSGKFAKFSGNLSYSFYLVHSPLIPVALAISGPLSSSKLSLALISFPIFLFISITISYFAYIFVEKPFIKFGKAFTKRLL